MAQEITDKSLEPRVSELENGTTWKLAGYTTGANAISLPTDFNELYIVVDVGTSYNVEFSPKKIYLGSDRDFRKGYYFNYNVTGCYCEIKVNLSRVILVNAYDTSDKISTSNIFVYYR